MSMLLSFGQDMHRPLLTAAVYNSEVRTLQRLPGFVDSYDFLTKRNCISTEADDHLTTYRFLTAKMNRLKIAGDRKKHIAGTVMMLQWLSRYSKAHELSPARAKLSIDAGRSLDANYEIRIDARWPRSTDEVISRVATTAMRGFVKQVGLVPAKTPLNAITGYQAFVRRNRHGISLQTDPNVYHKPGVDSPEHDPLNATFYLEPRGVASHAEQLVYLVGSVAAALADEYAGQIVAA